MIKKMLHNIINGKGQVLLHDLIWVFKKWIMVYDYIYIFENIYIHYF